MRLEDGFFLEISDQRDFLLLSWVYSSLAVRESSNNLFRVRLLCVVTVALLGLDHVVRGSLLGFVSSVW